MEELVELIVGKYDGSLKAEHGTGVNMAPYVEREWGAKATADDVADQAARRPARRAQPGRRCSTATRASTCATSRRQPPIEEVAAHCVECGFCEPVCPSRNMTTTPRQRIVLRREMARQPEGSPVLRGAAAPTTSTTRMRDVRRRRNLPGGLPGGDRHRQADEGVPPRASAPTREERGGARRSPRARRSSSARRAPGCAVRARRRPCSATGAVARVPELVRRRVSDELVPALPREPAAAGAGAPAGDRARGRGRRLPAGVHQPHLRQSARQRGAPSLPEALVAVSARAGLPLWIPADVAGHCCATPWSSKGYQRGHEEMARQDRRRRCGAGATAARCRS